MQLLKRSLLGGLVLLSLIPGCSKRGKLLKSMPLKPYSKVQDDVHVLVRPFTAEDSKEQFGRDALKKGYLPIQVIVENNTDAYYILHPWYIGLPLVSPKRVAKDLHHDSLIIVTSMVMVGIIGINWFAPLTWSLLLAAPAGVTLAYRNRMITKNVRAYVIDRGVESIIIPPFAHINRYFFVDELDVASQFTLTLLNGHTNKPLHFDVKISPSSVIAGEMKK